MNLPSSICLAIELPEVDGPLQIQGGELAGLGAV